MSRRGAEKIFGIVAILGGLAIVVGAVFGWTAGPVVLVLVNAVVIGWVVYYLTQRHKRVHRVTMR